MLRHTSLLFVALALAPGCTTITDFGHFHSGDIDGGGTDGGGTDGGGVDVGPHDAGPDVGPHDGGPDAGPNGCGTGCGRTEVCCEQSCIAVDTINHCGGCDVVCTGVPNAAPRCALTGCAFDCQTGFDDCNTRADDGCERSITTATDCGMCDHACNTGEVCRLGHCVSGCMGSEMNCGGTCADVTNNPDHCGNCAMACPVLPGTDRMCVNSNCMNPCMTGYSDCDGNPANGCEALVALYPDADNDGHGAMGAAASMRCANASGYVASHDDCNDADGSRHPGAQELCNTVDDDCNGQIDDGVTWNGTALGAQCQCQTGSVLGNVICMNNAAICTYGQEVCNNLDDDCDGNIDNGFTCRLGQTQPCSRTVSGCTYTGTSQCDNTCNYGVCNAPAEVCDGTDQNCNGYVDEGAWGVRTPHTGFGGASASFRAAFNGTSGGVAMLEDNAAGRTLSFTGFDNNGNATGTRITVASSTAAMIASNQGINGPFDIAYDNGGWIVFYMNRPTSSTSEVRYVSISSTGALGTSTVLQSNVVALDVAQGPASVGIAMGSGTQLYGAIIQNGVVVRTPIVVAMGANLDYPSIAFMYSNRFAVVASDLNNHYIDIGQFDTSGAYAVAHAVTDAQTEIDAFAYYDSVSSGSLLIAYRLSGTGLPYAIRADANAGTTLGGPLDLVSSNGPAIVQGAGGIWINRRPGISRVRPGDMTLFPGEMYAPNCSDLIATQNGMLCFYGDGTLGGVSVLLGCP